MYFSSELFVKRGPLGHLWLAGTVFHKLSKKVIWAEYLATMTDTLQIILSCDVPEMCHSIEKPPIPLALPARAQLFLGVCRIMDKQAKYLLIDATEAQSRVQLAVTTSSVNLASNRVQAKSDTINVVGEVDDYILPPIPLDCFDSVMEKETALFLNQSNLDDFCLMNENHLYHINLDLETSLPPQDTLVALEKTLFDPLAVMDENEAPYSLADPNQSILVQEDDFGPMPDIAVADPDERRQSLGSVRSKVTADTFNVSIISRKRKRNLSKPDSKIDISIDVLKHELADTSKILTSRPQIFKGTSLTLDSSNLLRFLRSATICELSDELQACYEKESTREFPNMGDHLQKWDDFKQPPISPGGFEPNIELNDDILSFKSANLSIERGRDVGPLLLDEEQHAGNTFLGHELTLASPNVHTAGSNVKLSPEQMRRVSIKSLGSFDSKTRRLSSINESGLSDFQTPDLNLPVSQFDVPHVEVAISHIDPSRRHTIGQATEILKNILEDYYQSNESAQSCHFQSVIEAAVGPDVLLSRRDAALSFVQLLVLKTMDMVVIAQREPYGPIQISRTPLFSLGFSDSQIAKA